MRKERLNSQINSAHNLRVRAIQSTQVNLGRSEEDLIFRSNDAKEHDIQKGQTLRIEGLKQLESLTNCWESRVRGNWNIIKSQNITPNRLNTPRYFVNSVKNNNERSLEQSLPAKHNNARKRPVTSSSSGQVADDISENVLDASSVSCCNSDLCRLNLDNSAKRYRGSRTKGSARKCKTKSNSKTKTGKQEKAASGTRVITLPPNSILKITSQSSLKVREGQKAKSSANKVRAESAIARTKKRFKSSSGDLENVKNVKSKHRSQLKSEEDDESDSSRYRLTPCPTNHSSSPVSRQTSASKRSHSHTSSAAMIFRSSSKASSRYSGSKRHRRMGTSRSVTSSSRRKRARSWYSGLSQGSLFNRSRKGRRRRKSSHYSQKRRRRMSSPRRRRSRLSPRRRLSRRSVSGSRRRRGRPRNPRKKSTSMSVSDIPPVSQVRSFGLLDRVGNLWRSVSYSRSGLAANASTSSNTTPGSLTQSWVSRILPKSRSKYQKQLRRYRDKASSYIRSRKDEKAAARRKASRISSIKGSKKEKQPGICSIM